MLEFMAREGMVGRGAFFLLDMFWYGLVRAVGLFFAFVNLV